jgi:hypothetical protein
MHYFDKLYCGHCDRTTKQKVNEEGHERDSSNDSFECLECGHIKFGLSGEWIDMREANVEIGCKIISREGDSIKEINLTEVSITLNRFEKLRKYLIDEVGLEPEDAYIKVGRVACGLFRTDDDVRDFVQDKDRFIDDREQSRFVNPKVGLNLKTLSSQYVAEDEGFLIVNPKNIK